MDKPYKANFHAHTSDDPKDPIPYTVFEYIDEGKRLGFHVLAVTCHNKFAYKEEYKSYAEEKGITLIFGIEKEIEGGDVIILNPQKDAETISSLEELRQYKKAHPEIFVIAPHPYLPIHSLGTLLEKYIDVFDAIESTWFYSKRFNMNVEAERIAKKYNLPFIATSDTHDLGWLEYSYALIDAHDASMESVFRAIREHKYVNKTSPRKFFRELVFSALKFLSRDWLLLFRKRS